MSISSIIQKILDQMKYQFSSLGNTYKMQHLFDTMREEQSLVNKVS
jgi:hypothetical protein